jgi:hypothetical protein
MFRINYILKRPERILPWGDKEKYLHWSDGQTVFSGSGQENRSSMSTPVLMRGISGNPSDTMITSCPDLRKTCLL